eukprot:s412_g8.t1
MYIQCFGQGSHRVLGVCRSIAPKKVAQYGGERQSALCEQLLHLPIHGRALASQAIQSDARSLLAKLQVLSRQSSPSKDEAAAVCDTIATFTATEAHQLSVVLAQFGLRNTLILDTLASHALRGMVSYSPYLLCGLANSFARNRYLHRPLMDAIAIHVANASDALSPVDIAGYAELAYNPRNNLLELCAERLQKTYLEVGAPNCASIMNSYARLSECNPAVFHCLSRAIVHAQPETFEVHNISIIMNSYAKCAACVTGASSLEEIFFLNSSKGASLLRRAFCVPVTLNGWDSEISRPFWQLSPYFLTELPGQCGPTTAIMILNALRAQGLEAAVSSTYSSHFGNYSQEYHYWDSKNLWSANKHCVKEHTTPWEGSLEQVAALMTCHGAAAKSVEANSSSLAEFRATIKKAFGDELEAVSFVAINFNRQTLRQRGDGVGHHSPIGAYDEETDRVLVLDVARYKYPPWWAALSDVFAAMQSYVPGFFSTPRGYIEVGMPKSEGILAVRKSQTMHLLGDYLVDRVDELSPQNVSNVVHAFSRLSCYNLPLFQNLVKRVDGSDLYLFGMWLQVPRPGALPLELRRQNCQARAAYSLATFRGQPLVEACAACGEWTASWCEGRYLREERSAEKPLPYRALCTACDQLHLVCDLCTDQQISWADGNAAATGGLGHVEEEPKIQITGYWTEDGTFVPADDELHLIPNTDGSPDCGAPGEPTA